MVEDAADAAAVQTLVQIIDGDCADVGWFQTNGTCQVAWCSACANRVLKAAAPRRCRRSPHRDAVEGRHRDAVEGRRRDVVEDRRTETPSSTSLDGCSAGADKRVELTDFKGLVVEPGGVVKKLELDSSASEPFIERRLLTMFEGASGG